MADAGPASLTPTRDGVPLDAALRRRLLNPLFFRAYLWRQLPLAALAGLRLDSVDDEACTVSIPGGFRTRNPFGSMYFAAQAMAAEMSTGVPALLLARSAPGSVAFIVREVRGEFLKRILTRARFTFSGIAAMRGAVGGAGGDGSVYVARSEGVDESGTLASVFEVTWSFKKRP
jgi:hypothetical protein